MKLELVQHGVRGFDPQKDAGAGGKPILELAFNVDPSVSVGWTEAARGEVKETIDDAIDAWRESEPAKKVVRLRFDLERASGDDAQMAKRVEDLELQVELALDGGRSCVQLEKELADATTKRADAQRRVGLLQKLLKAASRAAEVVLRAAVDSAVRAIAADREASLRDAVGELEAAVAKAYEKVYRDAFLLDNARNGTMAAHFVNEALAAESVDAAEPAGYSGETVPSMNSAWS